MRLDVSQRKRDIQSVLKATAPGRLSKLVQLPKRCATAAQLAGMRFQLTTKLDKALRPVPESPLEMKVLAQVFSDDFVTEVTDDQVMSWCNEHAITVPDASELHAIVLSLARRHIVARSRLAVLKVIADPRCANRKEWQLQQAARQNTQPPHPPTHEEAGRQPTAREIHGKLAI